MRTKFNYDGFEVVVTFSDPIWEASVSELKRVCISEISKEDAENQMKIAIDLKMNSIR